MLTLLLPLLLKPFPGEVLRNEVVEFKPKAEHHFSMEAPQKCASNAPVEATARAIKCQFVKSGEASAVLNVCDDKKTFCKPVTVSLNVSEKAGGEPVRLVKNEHLNQELKKTLVPGFTVGEPEEIIKAARAKKQPVLVMISTDWCPPCNEAKEYLLNSAAFQKITEDWFKVYVDGDSLAAVAWEKHVPYKYYPSFVLLNSKMDEIARYNLELRQGQFIGWAKEQVGYMKDPIRKLKKRILARKDGSLGQKLKDLFVKSGPADRHGEEVRLLRWALDQQDHEVMAKVTENSSFPELSTELTKYKISQIETQEKPDKAQKLALLKTLVNATFKTDDWAENLEMLCDEDEAECKAQLAKVEERQSFVTAKSTPSRKEMTDSELYSAAGEEFYYLASIFEKLKNKSKQKEFANKCAAAYENLAKLSHLKLGRGAQQTLVPCLEMAERYVDAEKLLKNLIETYPSEPTFMVRMARLLKRQKKLDQALVWLEKGETVAYGFNWFSAQLIKSDILLDLRREKDAEKVIKQALEEVRVSEDRSNRNQLVAARLRAAQTKIQERLVK